MTALILVYSTKYAHSYCAIHLPRSLAPRPATTSLSVAIRDDLLNRPRLAARHEWNRGP